MFSENYHHRSCFLFRSRFVLLFFSSLFALGVLEVFKCWMPFDTDEHLNHASMMDCSQQTKVGGEKEKHTVESSSGFHWKYKLFTVSGIVLCGQRTDGRMHKVYIHSKVSGVLTHNSQWMPPWGTVDHIHVRSRRPSHTVQTQHTVAFLSLLASHRKKYPTRRCN